MNYVTLTEQLLHSNVQRFRGGLVFKAHKLCVSLNSRLECNTEEEERLTDRLRFPQYANDVEGTACGPDFGPFR